MKVDIVIKNGHVVDTARNIDKVSDVGVNSRRIVDIENKEIQAVQTIDATGCYVLPGLIDFHTHINSDGSTLGTPPTLLAASGVTSAVDAGTCGCITYPFFHKSTVVNSLVRVKSFLSCYSLGLCGLKFLENFDPTLFDEERIAMIKDRYSDEILGLKMRFSIPLVKDFAPLDRAFEIAEKQRMPLCVHTTNPPCSTAELAKRFRKGDIYAHMYHGRGNTILDEHGNIHKEVIKARERGVIFDMAHGNNHFSNEICKVAFEQGFFPDIISTDMSGDKMYYGIRARSLPFVMSKLLSLGMNFNDVVRCVTDTPARLMGMAGQIGTLAPGALADVAILKIEEREFPSIDFSGQIYVGNALLLPQMTIIDGKIVFALTDFSLKQ